MPALFLRAKAMLTNEFFVPGLPVGKEDLKRLMKALSNDLVKVLLDPDHPFTQEAVALCPSIDEFQPLLPLFSPSPIRANEEKEPGPWQLQLLLAIAAETRDGLHALLRALQTPLSRQRRGRVTIDELNIAVTEAKWTSILFDDKRLSSLPQAIGLAIKWFEDMHPGAALRVTGQEVEFGTIRVHLRSLAYATMLRLLVKADGGPVSRDELITAGVRSPTTTLSRLRNPLRKAGIEIRVANGDGAYVFLGAEVVAPAHRRMKRKLS